jgi:hypothetical protein
MRSAILAARRNKKAISMAEINDATDRVIAGAAMGEPWGFKKCQAMSGITLNFYEVLGIDMGMGQNLLICFKKADPL